MTEHNEKLGLLATSAIDSVYLTGFNLGTTLVEAHNEQNAIEQGLNQKPKLGNFIIRRDKNASHGGDRRLISTPQKM